MQWRKTLFDGVMWYWPYVDGCIVLCGPEQDVGGSVPQSDDLVGVGLGWHTFGTSQSEVGQLQLALVVDEQVLRLQVAVQDASGMAEGKSPEKLH